MKIPADWIPAFAGMTRGRLVGMTRLGYTHVLALDRYFWTGYFVPQIGTT
jgi:hypothetical protein